MNEMYVDLSESEYEILFDILSENLGVEIKYSHISRLFTDLENAGIVIKKKIPVYVEVIEKGMLNN